MKILITGGTGFIGTRLAKVLANRGELVNVLCRSSADTSFLLHPNIRIIEGDILDRVSLDKAIEECDRVYHLAAYAKNWAKTLETFLNINVGGLKNVLEAAKNHSVKKIVFTSSALTLGPSNGVPVSESIHRKSDCFTDYEFSKIKAERLVQEYVQQGLSIVIVNPTRVFGPGLLNEGNSVTKMIDLYLRGKWRLVLGNGSAVGNYVFVDDVVRGHIGAMEYGRTGERYILGGENLSFNKFFEYVSELGQRTHRMIHIPRPLAMVFATTEKLRAEWFNHYPLITPGWVKIFINDWACSTEKAEKEIHYRITPFRDALRQTIEWLYNNKSNGGR